MISGVLPGKEFNVFLTFEGPGGKAEVANKFNPVKGEDIGVILRELGEKFDNGIFNNEFGLEVTGIKIVQHKESEDDV